MKVKTSLSLTSENIFPGIGIGPMNWASDYEEVKNYLDLPDEFRSEYFSEYDLYMHIILYHEKGIAFNFLSEKSTLQEDDKVFIYDVFQPYSKTTETQIGIGSHYNKLVSYYGEPDYSERINMESRDDMYLFDFEKVGVLCYASVRNDLIRQLSLYEPYKKKSKAGSIKFRRLSCNRSKLFWKNI